MFEGFPYTNFHELNLDWIIKLIKDFMVKYPGIVEDLNNKLNKPVFNPDGSLGNILVSNGDGTTKWEDASIVYAPTIVEAVNEWLNDHPEATTTVEDGSISIPKLNDYLKYKVQSNNGGFIAPIYVGDYIIPAEYLPSAVVKVNNEIIVVDAPTRNFATQSASGMGFIRRFSLEQNALLNLSPSLVGHGNSIAFDGTYYYIVPIWEYTDGTEYVVRIIYKYDTEFNFVSNIRTPSAVPGPGAISFDPVTETLYLLCGTNILTYNPEADEFNIYGSITFPSENTILDRSYNQDIAIYNNEFYISSPYGNIIHGKVEPGVWHVTDSFYVSSIDNVDRFRMGELEGMEFDNDGRLYAVMIITLGTNQERNAFVVELPVNVYPQQSTMMSGTFTVKDGSFELSEATLEKFYLDTWEIRSLNQLAVRTAKGITSNVTIPNNNNVVDPCLEIRLSESITITLNGYYTCNKLHILSGIVTIYAGSDSNQLILRGGLNNLIEVARNAILGFVGPYRVHCYTPDMTSNTNSNFINKGSNYSISYTRLAPDNVENKIMKLGANILRDYDMQFGQTGMFSLGNGLHINHLTGYITQGSTGLRLFFTSPVQIPNNVTVTGDMTVRTCKGYLDGASTTIDLSDPTYVVSVIYTPWDYCGQISISKADGTVFTNVDNNTPIDAIANIVIK